MMIVNEPYFVVLFREYLVQLAIIIYNVSLEEILVVHRHITVLLQLTGRTLLPLFLGLTSSQYFSP